MLWNQVFLSHEFPDLKFDFATYLSILWQIETRGASQKNREAENKPVEPAMDNASEGRRNNFKAASPDPEEWLFIFLAWLDSEKNEENMM